MRVRCDKSTITPPLTPLRSSLLKLMSLIMDTSILKKAYQVVLSPLFFSLFNFLNIAIYECPTGHRFFLEAPKDINAAIGTAGGGGGILNLGNAGVEVFPKPSPNKSRSRSSRNRYFSLLFFVFPSLLSHLFLFVSFVIMKIINLFLSRHKHVNPNVGEPSARPTTAAHESTTREHEHRAVFTPCVSCASLAQLLRIFLVTPDWAGSFTINPKVVFQVAPPPPQVSCYSTIASKKDRLFHNLSFFHFTSA